MLGNFNQAHEMFLQSADKQSATNALFSVCWSNVRRVSLWKDYDLDFILHKGNNIFTNLGLRRALNIHDLPSKLFIENTTYHVSIVSRNQVNLVENSTDATFSLDENLFFSEKVTGVVFFIDGLSFSILKGKDHKKVFVFDSQGNGTINETEKV